jgi:hypothetical protein
MPTYFFEVRDSDGNDCTVFDALVTARDREQASAKLWEYLHAEYPGTEDDGGYGTFHPCDCVCEDHGREIAYCDECQEGWECSHGGLLTNEDCDGPYGVQEYATVEEAMGARARYHSLIDLTETEDNA